MYTKQIVYTRPIVLTVALTLTITNENFRRSAHLPIGTQLTGFTGRISKNIEIGTDWVIYVNLIIEVNKYEVSLERCDTQYDV